jgi:putative ABC transport system permease protein
MHWLYMLLARAKGSVHSAQTEAELTEELHSHLEMLVDDKMRSGVLSEEARRLAMLELGGHTQIHEAYRRQQGLPFLELLMQDARYCLRTLRRYPGFASVAVVTLALGIGANTAIFSILNGVLLQPLPYSHPEQLVSAFSTFGGQEGLTSPPDFRTLRRQNHTLAGLSAYYETGMNLTGTSQPERVRALIVSADYFNTLGVQPALGRNFLPGEEQWGSHRVAIVSDAFWRSHLNRDRNLTGTKLTLDGESYSVIGVAPAGFYVERPVQVWLPMAWKPHDNYDSHNNYFISMLGRLRPGVTQQQVFADLNAIMLGIAQQFPENKGIGAALKPLRDVWLGDARPALMVLVSAVAFVLLIACVNLANLLLARSAARRKEIAIRSALGANRRRLLRQFLTESILLSCLGGAVGLALAYFSLHLLPLAGNMLPRIQQVRLDGWVLLFTAAVSVTTGLLFGLIPAFKNSRVAGVNETLKERGRYSFSASTHRFRSALVISEVALATVLLAGSGLAIRSFTRLLSVDPGFSPDHVLTFSVNLPQSYDPQPDPLRIGAPPQVTQFFEQLLSRIEQLPGVKSAGCVSSLPLQGENWGKFLVPLDRPIPASIDQAEHVQYRAIFGHYFDALRIRLLQGRLINEHDGPNNPFAVVINEALARRDWPGQNPIGKVILLSPPLSLLPPGVAPAGYQPQKFTVVGVVSDVHYGSMQQSVVPVVYASLLQHDYSLSPSISIRSAGDPKLLIASIRDVLAQIDKNVPMARVMTMEEIMSSSVAQPRLEAILLGFFGALAMLLAAVGIYGVIAYSVSQRTSEIGIRMALGASRPSVLFMVLSQGMRFTAIGLGAGLALALALTRLMAGILFGISPTDPATYATILGLLAIIALLACYLPARRATRVDPMVALRYE